MYWDCTTTGRHTGRQADIIDPLGNPHSPRIAPPSQSAHRQAQAQASHSRQHSQFSDCTTRSASGASTIIMFRGLAKYEMSMSCTQIRNEG